MQDLVHKILLALTALTIVGEVATIIIWIVNPELPLGIARSVLAVDYTIAVANGAVFVVLNLVALILIERRNKNGPLFLIAISILNKLVSFPIFVAGGFNVFMAWAIVLVIFAYLDYRRISKG